MSYREGLANAWLEYIVANETLDFQNSCCVSGTKLDLGSAESSHIQCCPMYAGITSPQPGQLAKNINLSDTSSNTEQQQLGSVKYEVGQAGTAEKEEDERITVGMTTCRRLLLFMRTMKKLLQYSDDIHNSLIKEVCKHV